MSAIRRRLGTNLRRLRTRLGLTQEDLAASAGLDPKYLGEVERGNETISVDRLGRIADSLGVDPRLLFEPLTRKGAPRRDGFDPRLTAMLRKAPVDQRRLLTKILRLIARS